MVLLNNNRKANTMRRFIARFRDKITGVLQGFDRIVFRGWLGRFLHEGGMSSFLADQGVLLKDFELMAKVLTDDLRGEADRQAAKLDDKVHYLVSPNQSKEHLARELLNKRGGRTGPIGVLSALEPCFTWQVRRSRAHLHPQHFQRKSAKCLHYYHYRLDPRFGFMHVRIQSWFPFQVRICMNGRDWLGQQLDRHRLRYERADNCFPWIAHPDRAQELMDDFLYLDWPRILDGLAFSANPTLGVIADELDHGFYWTVWQSEWATDVMFRDKEHLQECYPAFVHHAIGNLQSPDVLRFLGKKLTPQYRAEVTTDYKNRVEGIRVKHSANWNSVKMYDKFGRVLRVEATINKPGDFKVRRRAQGDPESPAKMRPLRRGITDLRRLASTGTACTRRYLDTLATVTIDTPLGTLLEPITRPTDLNGQRVRGLRPWADPDIQLLQGISRGEFLTTGFRNRDLLPLLFPGVHDDPAERRKLSAKVTRLLRILRAHHLIQKVDGTHRYVVTATGRTAIAAILAARSAPLSLLQKCA
jgi:hypothetical protein